MSMVFFIGKPLLQGLFWDAFLWGDLDLDQDQWFNITQIMVHQRDQWIHSSHRFIAAFNKLWSVWSWITDPEADHPKGSHTWCQGFIHDFYLGFKMDFGLINIWPALGLTSSFSFWDVIFFILSIQVSFFSYDCMYVHNVTMYCIPINRLHFALLWQQKEGLVQEVLYPADWFPCNVSYPVLQLFGLTFHHGFERLIVKISGDLT